MSNATGERVFHHKRIPNLEWTINGGKVYVRRKGQSGWEQSAYCDAGELKADEAIYEIATTDPLTAYATFVAEIDAAFLETNRQAIQIGYQRARDRLSDALNQSRGAM